MTPFEILTVACAIFMPIVSAFCFVVWYKIAKTEEKADAVAERLAEFKLYVAREHPNNEALDKVVHMIIGQFENVVERLGAMELDLRQMSSAFRDRLEDKVDRRDFVQRKPHG